MAIAAVGGVFLAGCGDESASPKKDGEKFTGGQPPAGFVESRMKNRVGNGAPAAAAKNAKHP